MCVWCVRVWIEREREGERERERVCNGCDRALMYNYSESEKNICVIIFVTPFPLPLHDLVKRLELLRIGVRK